jgi:hypothetical protein
MRRDSLVAICVVSIVPGISHDRTHNTPQGTVLHSQRDTSCVPPTSQEPPHLPRDLNLANWAGRYSLFAVATWGTPHQDTVIGVVTLAPNTDASSRKPILVGYAASDMHWPGYLSFAHSPASRASAQHGAEVYYDREQGAITIVFGNSGNRATDSGVFFDVFGIDPASMVGLWEDGGLGVFIDSAGKSLGHPRGFFCLRRTQG